MNKVPDYIRGLKEVSCAENGAKIVYAEDDFFAVAENLLKREEPQTNDEYTEFGKWMDGWETRRKRDPGHENHDWTIITLSEPCFVRAVCVDTAYFTGNHAPQFSLQGYHLERSIEEEVKALSFYIDGSSDAIQNRNNKLGTEASWEDYRNISYVSSRKWPTLIDVTPLGRGDPETRKNFYRLSPENKLYTHLRFNIYPDGGVARLRVYGFGLSPTDYSVEPRGQPVKGKCIGFSDAHYGHPDNLVKPHPSEGMFDGWETARKLNRPSKIYQGQDNIFIDFHGEMDWAILKLEKTILINRIEVDTTHFKGNSPESVIIEGSDAVIGQEAMFWEILLPKTKLVPNKSNGLETLPQNFKMKPINHVKISIIPDGGIARIRIYGDEYVEQATL